MRLNNCAHRRNRKQASMALLASATHQAISIQPTKLAS